MVAMNFIRPLFNALWIKNLLGVIVWKKQPIMPQLVVINYHGTPKKYITNFENQIKFLLHNYEILTPEIFEKIANSDKPIVGRKLLITFDDGMRNNNHAFEILKKYNISAYVFVIPEFVDKTNIYQKEYYLEHIRPKVDQNFGLEDEDFQTLNWKELSQLSNFHTIGSHSNSHQMLANMSEQLLEKEILFSKIKIYQNINKSPSTFCSINNTLNTVSPKASSLIAQNYDFHFTTFPGNNIPIEKQLIKRVNIESHWPINAIKWALSPQDWNRYAVKITKYKNLHLRAK